MSVGILSKLNLIAYNGLYSSSATKILSLCCRNHQISHVDKFLLHQRHLFSGLPFGGSNKGKKLVYSEKAVLGYSMEQMFEIVSRVDRYPQFVPWCKEAVITQRHDDGFRCQLTVGFPPVVEKYSSIVTTSKPNLVRSECFDGILLNQLLAVWKFDHGLEDRPDTCQLDLLVEFEFRSGLHSQLAQMFFDEVVRTMVSAFLNRARKLYGPPSVKKKKTVSYTPTDR